MANQKMKNTLGRRCIPRNLCRRRDPGLIFVSTGNGVVGHRVAVGLLKAAEHPTVRVGVPSDGSPSSSAEEFTKMGAAVVNFSWADEDTYANAIRGARTVFCSTPVEELGAQRFESFLKACKEGGVKHIVKLSFFHALQSYAELLHDLDKVVPITDSDDDGVSLLQLHGFCDKKLVKSHIDYTILFATTLMSNPLEFQASNLRTKQKLLGSEGLNDTNYVSPNDVTDVAIHILLAPKDHHRAGYILTGPNTLAGVQVADLLGIHLNKRITFVNAPPSNFQADLSSLERAKLRSAEELKEFISADVEKILDRPAESYAEYLLSKNTMSPKEKAAFEI